MVFFGNPPSDIDPHHQITGFVANQMTELAEVIRCQVSLAAFGMLKDLLLMKYAKGGRSCGESEGVGIQSPFPSKTG